MRSSYFVIFFKLRIAYQYQDLRTDNVNAVIATKVKRLAASVKDP